MKEVSKAKLKRAVESQHGGKATFVEAVPVKETFIGAREWNGTVHVFDLAGHPRATRAYAWSSPVEGSDTRRFFAILHSGAVTSPRDAVKTALVADYKANRPRRPR